MASASPGRWQREYERDWRAYAKQAIAQRFGASCAQASPHVTRQDEREMRAVLAAAGIAHVPPNHRRWQAPFPATYSQQDENGDASTEDSYIYSTPEGKRRSMSPASSASAFPAFSSQEMASQMTRERRVSASQRLQMRMADMSPIATARRSSTGSVGTISPASATAKSPFEAGSRSSRTPGSSDSKKIPRRRSVGRQDAVDLDVSMRSMQLSDDEQTRIEEEQEDTQMSDDEEMQVDREGLERMNEEKTQAPGDTQREESQLPAGEQEETLPPYTETAPLEGEAKDEDEEAVAKVLAFNSDSELEDAEERCDVPESSRGQSQVANVEAPGDVAQPKTVVPPLIERVATHVSDEEMVQNSDPGFEFGFPDYEDANEGDGSDGSDGHNQQEAQVQNRDCLVGIDPSAAISADQLQPQRSEAVAQASAAVARTPTRGLKRSEAGYARPTATSSRKRQARASSREHSGLTPPTALASTSPSRSHKRPNRGQLLHTKLPLQMEYRFASDRRRRLRRRQTLATKPAVFAFVVPELLVELQPYQQEALQWMLEREQQADTPVTIEQQRRGEATAVDRLLSKLNGGVLADEMGLGKTVCCLALICESLRQARAAEVEAQAQAGDEYVPRLPPPTLIVTPLSILSQWEHEIRTKTNLSVVTYQGLKRKNFRSGAQFMGADIVLSTYDTLRLLECKVDSKHGGGGGSSDGETAEAGDASSGWHQAPRLTPRSQRRVVTSKLHQLAWQRVILDESHLISNASSARARAAFTLNSKRRWCVTGTPIQNRTEDLTALLQFVGLGQRAHSLSERELEALVPHVVLRRLKSTVDARSRAPILELPHKTEEVMELEFASDVESALYMLLHRSTKRQVLQYLQSKQSGTSHSALAITPTKDGKKRPLFMHVFELLLRLRQVCDACSLVTADPLAEVKARAVAASSAASIEAPVGVKRRGDGMGAFSPEETELLQRLQQQDAMDMDSNPLVSTKLKALMCELEKLRARGERALVISQWTSFLDLIGERLEARNAQCEMQAARSLEAGSLTEGEPIAFAKLDGRMAARDREQVVRIFQQQENASSGPGAGAGSGETPPPLDVLLLSLRTGGLGLNLTAASHVFLMEPSWNPSLERQAVDRAHRFGQRREVRVVRFIIKGTVEERVVELQNKKRQLTAAFLGDAAGKDGRAAPRAMREPRLSRGDLRRLFFSPQDLGQDEDEDEGEVEIVEPEEEIGERNNSEEEGMSA